MAVRGRVGSRVSHTVVRDSVHSRMSDSVSVFAEHAREYDGQRRRLVPSFELFYGTAVDVIALREGPVNRVLDLGAGTGLMAAAVLERYPNAELVLLDGSQEMLAHARERLPRSSTAAVVADLRDELPPGPFDAVVSALAIHHLEHPDKRDLLRRVRERLRAGGVFVNAEHVAGPTPWLEGAYRDLWRTPALPPVPHPRRSRARRAEWRWTARWTSPPSSRGWRRRASSSATASSSTCTSPFSPAGAARLTPWPTPKPRSPPRTK